MNAIKVIVKKGTTMYPLKETTTANAALNYTEKNTTTFFGRKKLQSISFFKKVLQYFIHPMRFSNQILKSIDDSLL